MSVLKSDAFPYSQIASVTLGNKVSFVEDDAFDGCSSLASINVENGNSDYSSVNGMLVDIDCTTIIKCPQGKTTATIPNSVTAIGINAFKDCSVLPSITIPGSILFIGSDAFSGCSKLTSITLENDYSLSMFKPDAFPLSQITSVTLGNDVTSLEDDAFDGCSSLTVINVAKGNSNFNSISGMLVDKDNTTVIKCPPGVTTATIPNSVTAVCNYAFNGCDKLTSISLTTKVSSIGNYSFKNCSMLTSISIPNSILFIGSNAFSGCSKLTSLSLESDYSVSVLKSDAFPLSQITSVTLGNEVTSVEVGSFDGCSSLTVINVANDNSHYSSVDGMLVDKNETTIVTCPQGKINVTIPNSTTTVGDYAFFRCNKLTLITVPESVVSIGRGAFSECHELYYINVSDDNMGYSSINGLLLDKEGTVMIQCPGARSSVILPESVTSIGEEAFRSCIKLEWVLIPPSVNSVGARAFEDCVSLSHVCYLGTNDPGKSDNHVFDGCDVLDDVIVVAGYDDEEFCEKQIKRRDGVYVLLEMNDGVDSIDYNLLWEELDMPPDGVSVKVERDENGNIIRLLLFVDDEETANVISEVVEERRKGEDCPQALFCKVKSVRVIVRELSMSGASSIHDVLKSLFIMLVAVIFGISIQLL